MKLQKYLLALVFSLIASMSIIAQDDLRLVDELGDLGLDDILARTDGLAQFLQESSPDSKMVITISGPKSSLSTRYTKGAIHKAYLLNARKVSPDRLQIMHCAVEENYIHTRFYIAGPTAEMPECDQSLPNIDKSTHFGSAYFATKLYDGCCDIPGGDDEILKTMVDITADILAAQPRSKIVLIGYSGTNGFSSDPLLKKDRTLSRKPRKWDSPTIVNKKLREANANLKKQGVTAARVTTLYGGYRDWGSEVEFWIIPEDGAKPEIKPVYKIKK